MRLPELAAGGRSEMPIHACFAGSFDPVTFGHLDIVRRALARADRLVLAVGRNAAKVSLFSVEERVQFLTEALRGITPAPEVRILDGLVVDFCRKHGLNTLIRGLRTPSDFENEQVMALTNRKLAPEIETMLFVCSPEHLTTSSRLIKEIAAGGGALEHFVPPSIAAALRARLKGSA